MPILTQPISERHYVEYYDGRAYSKMSPKRRHGSVQGVFFGILRRCGSAFGQTASEWRFHLPGLVKGRTEFVPDVAFVGDARLAPLSGEEREEPHFAPDIAVEVRSPGDKLDFLRTKIAGYLDRGAVVVFDVNPLERTLVAHFADGRVTSLAERDRFSDDAVPWLAFDVAELFSDLDHPPSR